MSYSYDSSTIGHLFELVDQFGADFVANTYHHLVSDYAGTLSIFVTLYMGWVFINIQRGIIDGTQLPFIVLRVVCILTLAWNYHYFYLFIYDVVTNGPLFICKAITLQGNEVVPMNMTNALDHFLKAGFAASNQVFHMGSWSNLTYTLFGAGIFLATFLAVIIATGLIFLSKIASAVILALSPLFIFFALYESTKGWFDAYIQHLFTYFLIPIVTCSVLMIVLSVTDSTIQYMNSADKPSFKLLIPFVIACGVQIWLFLQIPQKCASLASGFNLKGVMATMRETNTGIQTMASTLTGGKIGRAVLASSWDKLKNGGSTAGHFIKNQLDRYRNPIG